MTATWILILTLTADAYSGGGSITAVPGFRSDIACMSAANAWLKQVQTRRFIQATALCVEQP